MATQYSPKIVTDGLVLCLDAGNRKSYPGSGTTWRDLTINRNNTTLVNSPTFNSDNSGNITFNGTNQYAESLVSLINVTSNWTVNVWYKTSGNTFVGPLLVRGNVAETFQWRCEVDASTGRVRFLMRNSTDQSVLGTTSTNGAGWHMATYTNNSNLVTVYLDGIAENTGTITNLTNSSIGTNAVIGKLGDTSGPYYFNGNIGLVQVYSQTLTARDVLQNFNATRGRFGI